MGFFARATLYLCVATLTGAVVFGTVLLARSRVDRSLAQSLRKRAAGAGLVAALLLLPAAALRLYLQLDALRFPGDPLTQALRPLLTDTTWGKALLLQCGAAVAVAGFFLLGRAGTTRWFAAAAVAALAVTLTIPFSGHAHTGPFVGISIAADALHVIAMSAWLGTLLVLTLAVRSPEGSSPLVPASEQYKLFKGFSIIALTSAATVILSGVVSSALRVGDIAALWGTPYGRVLILKVCLVGTVVFLGRQNWKRNVPLFPEDNGTATRSGATRELVTALMVILVTAVLVVTPPPTG